MNTRRKNGIPLLFATGIFFVAGIGLALPGPQPAKADQADHLVINEIAIDSISGSGGTDDDWVELYNPTDQAVPLDGWSIQKFAAGGTSGFSQLLNGTVPAKSYYLIVRNGATTNPALLASADLPANSSFNLALNNIIYLVHGTNLITPSAGSVDIVDFVGYGTVSYYEGAAAAPNITETKSISRAPDGNDTDDNAVDFTLSNTPTPNNSTVDNSKNLSGSVLLTVVLDTEPVQNITPISADIAFQANGDGTALINYGLTDTYGSATAPQTITANTGATISLTGLACGQTYHYSVYAENGDASESDATVDATFATLPCGIRIDSLTMTKTAAKANNAYENGWEWQYDITIWDMAETALKMKFNQWTGPAALDAAGNMEYSADNGTTWQAINGNAAYPDTPINLAGIDNGTAVGRQVTIIVKMKVPVGTKAGTYNSGYGILTE